MVSYAPGALVRQMEALGGDLRRLIGPVGEQVDAVLTAHEWRSVGHVYLTGSGDSHHAAQAAEAAFRRWAGLDCLAISTQPFVDDSPLAARRHRADHTDDRDHRDLVIGSSASGGTERVVQALREARESGALTVAVTGRAGSKVTRVAERSVVVELSGSEPSPGMRTYQATLLTLLVTAVRAAELRGADLHADDLCGAAGPPSAVEHRRELAGLADAVEQTAAAVRDRCRILAETLAGAPVISVVGSGPSRGTAMFAAAKIIEASGVPAIGQDLEEWWHVERFMRPSDLPVVVVAPPGRSHRRAVELAARARGLGRRVVTVQHEDDAELAGHAWSVLPVRGGPPEELSSLVYHVFGGYLAAALGTVLGRQPFQSGS